MDVWTVIECKKLTGFAIGAETITFNWVSQNSKILLF